METVNLNGIEVYICTRDEARELWKSDPDKHGRILLQEESTALNVLDTEDVMKVLAKKMADHRYIYKKGDKI